MKTKKTFLAGIISCSCILTVLGEGIEQKNNSTEASKPEIGKREIRYLQKRDFIISDTALKVKPLFVSLPAGAVYPQGWIKDWAVAAVNGITGHLDEWSVTYAMAWKGAGFKPRGTQLGWPLEQSSYWFDGAVRLAYILNDSALINKVTNRLDRVVNGVLNGGKSFIYWQDIDFKDKKRNFENWAYSHMGRALVAYYEASGDKRILDALTKGYSNFDIVPVPFLGFGVSGCTNVDPMLATYKLSGDKRILNAVLNMSQSAETKETVQKWNKGEFCNGHGVIVCENLRIPAMMYPWTNRPELLKATRQYLEWLDKNAMQPYGVFSSEEHLVGKGSTRNTETCNVATSAWTYQQLYELTGEGALGDRIEKIFFNAAPAPVSRDYKTMAYYQSPNRIENLLPSEIPGSPGKDSIPYIFRPTGHPVLCCVGNLTRCIPNYIMHMWMGTTDKGLAATLYGPSIVNTVVGKDVPVKITCKTDYPFKENLQMRVEPAKTYRFPLYLRIPEWCKQPQIKVNGKVVDINNPVSDFVKIDRKWKKGDIVDLIFPMSVEVITDRETPFPDTFRYQGRILAREMDVNSPYRTVFYGPLLFAFPVKDITSNQQAPDEQWNYAMVSKDAGTISILHSEMPQTWSWQIEEAPVKLKVKAKTFDWQPSVILPLPKEEVDGMEDADIILVPYGCTKFRITMFPIAKN